MRTKLLKIAMKNFDADKASENDNEKENTDIEKGYDSTVPLIHRIVQSGLNGQWYNPSSPAMKMMKTMGLNPTVYGPNPDQSFLYSNPIQYIQ